MKSQLSTGQTFSFIIGILVVAVVDVISPWSLTGPGWEGALRAAFWYGLVGVGGGLCAHEIIQRIKSQLAKSKNSN